MTSNCEGQTSEGRVERSLQYRVGVELRESQAQSQGALLSETAPPSPGDEDLGQQVILKKREEFQPFTLVADVSAFGTTNAALTSRNEQDDTFLVAQAGLSYRPTLSPDLIGEITVRESVFKYAEFDGLDFESFNIGGGITYIARPLWNIAILARYNFNRLTDGADHREFFKNHTLTFGLQKTVPLSRAHYYYAGLAAQWSFSDPVAPQRDEYSFYTGYHVDLTRILAADAYYRAAWYDYVNDRDDFNQTLALAMKLKITSWLAITASATAAFNRSDSAIFDYDAFNAGGGISATVKF